MPAGDMSLVGTDLSARGGLTFVTDRAATPSPAGGACSPSARPKGFTAGKPQVTYYEIPGTSDKPVGQMHWLHQAFKQSRSNRYGGVNHKSYVMCMKGGGKALNNNNLHKVLAGFSLDDVNSYFTYDGDTAITDGNADSRITVTAPVGPFSISGSVPIHPEGTAAFAPGRDQHTPDSFTTAQASRLLNVYWTGKKANAFEGNAGMGQWEVPQTKAFPGWRTYYYAKIGSRFCIGC